MDNYYLELLRKINENKARVCVIGLGYVGLNLALEIARNGFHVTGIDIDKDKVEKIKKGISYINNIKNDEIIEVVKKGYLDATDQYNVVNDNDIIIMALPTPIDQNKNPNLKFLENALKESMRYFKKGQLLILESTTYPGTTEEMIAPAIKAKEFKIGEDFFLAYAPERIDLGNKAYPMRKIPKIIAGVTKYCTELADSFYKKIVEKTYIASSPKVAEFTKLFENVFRLINIAYVEEMAKLCEKLGIDIWEAIELAKTKPFGYMPFYPSAGAGGDCIPVNPYYLDWVAKKVDYELKLVQTAVSINEDMYLHVLNRIEEVLRKRKKDIANSRILIVGVTYKKDVADIRNSPSIRLMEALIKLGADVSYFDPFIPKIMIAGKDFNSIELNNDNIRKSDIVVVLVDHSNIDYKLLYQEAKIIFDTKNVFKENEKIIKLGSGLSNL